MPRHIVARVRDHGGTVAAIEATVEMLGDGKQLIDVPGTRHVALDLREREMFAQWIFLSPRPEALLSAIAGKSV